MTAANMATGALRRNASGATSSTVATTSPAVARASSPNSVGRVSAKTPMATAVSATMGFCANQLCPRASTRRG